MAVTAGTSYRYTGWYRSNVDTEVDVEAHRLRPGEVRQAHRYNTRRGQRREDHEVGPTVEDPTYSVTPQNIDAELELIRDKGIAVSTVDQALDAVVPQLG